MAEIGTEMGKLNLRVGSNGICYIATLSGESLEDIPSELLRDVIALVDKFNDKEIKYG